MGQESKNHPAERFAAPGSIQRGQPLKDLMGARLVALIGESLATVVPRFDGRRFQREAISGLEPLELKERAAWIARAMAAQLPEQFTDAAPLVIQSLGPELTATQDNGLAPFFYLPHSQLIAARGVECFASGMRVNYELTKRFTAEFSIRPLIEARTDECLALLADWTADPNPHVRRLVSEGTRPRLPWAMRLVTLQSRPELTLPLLEKLKDDPELYVRRSVANHLADVLKDHPEFAYKVCDRWLDEVDSPRHDRQQAAARRWIVRHAVRLPAKKEERRALRLRTRAKDR